MFTIAANAAEATIERIIGFHTMHRACLKLIPHTFLRTHTFLFPTRLGPSFSALACRVN